MLENNENIDVPFVEEVLPDVSQPPDITETSAPTIQEIFPNYAEDEKTVESAKMRIRSLFSNISDRGDLEEIWQKNDEMYRVKPDESKDEEHRANEATGVFHISVNQLVSMTFKSFTDNPENYSYGYDAITDDETANIIRRRNAEILTQLLRKSMRETNFKRNLKQCLYDVYKNGTTFAAIPWEKQIIDLAYRDKETGSRKTKVITKNNFPKFEFIPLDSVWLDENIEDIDSQPLIAIRSPISWTKLLSDSKKNKIKLFEKEGDQSLFDKFEKYRENENTQFNTAKSDRFDNADRNLQDRTGSQYKHWICWVNLPINKETGKWDEEGTEMRCRVRLLGDPSSGDIIEIRENVFPGGVPILAAHQTQDDIGMYPISLGEKVATYYDQICVAVNQLIDNRSKNNRRPVAYDPLRVTKMAQYDFGHSASIAVDGDVRSALMELQIADITGTIMTTINYCEQKVREIMNTTEAVMGMALGGRTSASEYMGVKAAATTPIFSDMSSIEDALIGEYMRRFAQYIHLFMTLDDIIAQVGKIGAEFQFDLNDIYTVELRGASEFLNKAERTQNLMQLYGLMQDSTAKSRIILRLAKTMGMENPTEFVAIPAKDQAIKAALWENNEMLVYGKWDEPETGEMHDVHLPIHRQKEWEAQRDGNANINFIRQHIMMTEQLKKSEQSQGGSFGPFPIINGQSAAQSSLPGEVSGQNISAQFGNINAGSPVPAEQPAMPVSL